MRRSSLNIHSGPEVVPSPAVLGHVVRALAALRGPDVRPPMAKASGGKPGRWPVAWCCPGAAHTTGPKVGHYGVGLDVLPR